MRSIEIQSHIAAQERERAERERATNIAVSRQRWLTSGKRCDIEVATSSGGHRPCAEPAAGHCSSCEHVFCVAHQSYDRPPGFRVMIDECIQCQDQRVETVAAAAREAEKKARQAAEQRERRHRAHEAKVRAHEKENDWPGARTLLDEVERRRRELPNGSYEGPTGSEIARANAVLIVDVVAISVLGCGFVADPALSAPLVFTLGAILAIAMLALGPMSRWALRIRIQHSRHLRYTALIEERDELRSARGCGKPDCKLCRAEWSWS
ncbi:hypothetical protein ACFFX1_17545 [Dactylosporangium sucinum]|nr:hypothetical protein [Dactylosporangium sucinum]